jgi:hypothetical protein
MMNEIQEFCDKHNACQEGKDWALENCQTMDEVWRTAKPDWLIWVATRKGVLADKELRLFACWCVRQIWDLPTDERSKNAIIVAEKFAKGEATEKELKAAADAAATYAANAYAAYAAATYAADAAATYAANAYATYAANAYATYAAAYAAAAYAADAYAADAAAAYAADAADAARQTSKADQAKYLRSLYNPFKKQ